VKSRHSNADSVHGINFWDKARKTEERHKISSVLIGLEGAAPQKKSPFGVEHDVSGTSHNVSALGGQKWRAYRLNNALQIPSDEDGMHMKITRRMFEELIETCDQIGLGDPCIDLVSRRVQGYTREVLDQRYAEKELFKQILGGNGPQAKQSVEWMKEHSSTHRTPAQAYAAICRYRSKVASSPKNSTATFAHSTAPRCESNCRSSGLLCL